jgi:hypothetical protein
MKQYFKNGFLRSHLTYICVKVKQMQLHLEILNEFGNKEFSVIYKVITLMVSTNIGMCTE